jgi:hypothetical protein
VLYWLLKVAVPQIRGGRMVERGGVVGGIFGGWLESSFAPRVEKVGIA